MIDFEYLTNPEKYHTVPPRVKGEKDEQYKARLEAYVQGIKSQQANIDELQARVDEIASHVDINFDEDRDDDQHSYWSGYNQAMRELNDILKGNKDEN